MKNTLIHSFLVGLIAACVVLISEWLGIKAWIIFFGWANYFLYTCNIIKSFKMLFAFLVGILFALLGAHAIEHLNYILSPDCKFCSTVLIIFGIASILTFFEIIESWKEFVPATFLGTVLFFASEVTFRTILPDLLLPLCIGIFTGFVTLSSREKLTIYLNQK